MRKKRMRSAAFGLCAGFSLVQGCPLDSLISGILSDCFGSDTISAREYDDLNIFEQLLYEENDCGRYQPREL